VADRAHYHAIQDEAEKIFIIGKAGLPSQVFRDKLSSYHFLEFDLMLAPRFWDLLVECARICGDTELRMLVIDPDPETYYFKHFNRYGAITFPVSARADDYGAALDSEPKNSPTDALRYVASIVTWFGNSCAWGFWGERELGVGVGATKVETFQWPEIGGIKWFDLDSALSELVVLNFKKRIIPPSFVSTIRENFLE
jgi:hypothetical protein